MPKGPKRTRRSARAERDAKLVATLELVADMLGKLNEAAARLEQRIERATERIVTMRLP